MSRDEALNQLRDEFGRISSRSLSSGECLAVICSQHIPDGEQTTKIALRLPEVITSAPKIYVEPHVSRNDGTHPSSANNIDVEGEAWREWSLSVEWDAGSHSLPQLVYAALSRFA